MRMIASTILCGESTVMWLLAFSSTAYQWTPQSSRAWYIVWDAQFFEYCQAVSGSLRFDLGLYRSLDFASRRLFLLLQKIFWRNDHTPPFELRKLGVETLGFSAQLPSEGDQTKTP